MGYVPQYDGVRALAVFAVLAFHARAPGFEGAFFGVDIFFVLSGFLITRVLVGQSEEGGRLALGNFHLRRLRRLYPALILLLTVYVVAAPALFPDYQGHQLDALIAGFYLSDYARAWWDIPEILQHTWSLAVEEHFYLIWPIVLTLVLKLHPSRRVYALVAMFLLTCAWRTWLSVTPVQWTEVYYRFDTRLTGLVAGSLLALTAVDVSRAWGFVGVLMVCVAMAATQWRDPAALGIWMLVVETGSVLLVAGASREPLLSPPPCVAWPHVLRHLPMALPNHLLDAGRRNILVVAAITWWRLLSSCCSGVPLPCRAPISRIHCLQ